MIRIVLAASIPVILMATGAAEEPKELRAARAHFAQASPHASEAERAQYVTGLVRLRDRLAHNNTGNGWQAVDAEIMRYPAPKDSDPKALAGFLVGKWKSPRHDYLFRKDGTWLMLPDEPETPHGNWRFEGNQYFDTVKGDASRSNPCTVILLNATDFVFTDGKIVFYETRIAK
jgi:hypothetical protein